MKQLKYKCTLLTDIIINQKSATEGNQKTLDFIPGSNFLGIAASQLYPSLSKEEAWYLFHSGKCIFGDGHLMSNHKRSIKVPASLYYPKLEKEDNDIYVHHNINDHKTLIPLQLKQHRNGFYILNETSFTKLSDSKNFSLKSAYDREKRKSADSKMFGYEALEKGLCFGFEIILDTDKTDLIEKLDQAMKGIKHIGRSRSAQYGMVEITSEDYDDFLEMKSYQNHVIVYAESRLIFIDKETLLPTYKPQVEQILGEGIEGEIDWSRSQIRTFQYAPWNYKRQCYDTDRCGIEKGSVIYIKTQYQPSVAYQYVGMYKNEGFGKIRFNPTFLESQPNQNGKWKFKMAREEEKNTHNTNISSVQTPLINYLRQCKTAETEEALIYKRVNEFVLANTASFKQEKFASQWGAIRAIAMANHETSEHLIESIEEYIHNGVASEKWKFGKRDKLLICFMNEHKTNINYLRKLIINLASEMAKKSSKNE